MGTLIFTYIRRLGPFFGVQNFEFQYFFLVFRKMNIFGGMKILWIFFGGHKKIGLYLGVISMQFMVFTLKSRYRMEDILGLLKFQIYFWGA